MLTIFLLVALVFYATANAHLRDMFHPLAFRFELSVVALVIGLLWPMALAASFLVGASWHDWSRHGYRLTPGPLRPHAVSMEVRP